MQNLNVYDLTLAEVREIINDPNANWRKDAVCVGMDTNDWIFPADAKGLKQSKCMAKPFQYANNVQSDQNVWLLLLNINAPAVFGED